MLAYSKTKLPKFKIKKIHETPKLTTVNLTSLGCAKNLVDSEVMLGLLNEHGYRMVPDGERCDVAIVNTCGFIESSRKESIDEILRLAELKSRGKARYLIVAGCLAQKHSKDLVEEIPEIDAVVGTGEFQKIHLIVGQLDKNKTAAAADYPTFLYDETMPRIALTAAHSRFIKIAEGCNHTCSFCIIPQMRGVYRSRPVNSIVSEVKDLVRSGLKEACIISQETTYYGRDIDRTYHLPSLLHELDKINGLRWIRLFYNHPLHMDTSIIEAIAQCRKVVPYVDMPLQHISDRMLKSMNRGVTKERTVRLLDEIRRTIPNVILRTTFIVGYPGETAEEFDELCAFVKETQFDHVGIFTYSREKDVPSGHLPNQLNASIKKERYQRLMEIQQSISLKQNQKLLGTTQEVLIERDADKPQWYVGRAARHAPDIDGNIFLHSPRIPLKAGDFIHAQVKEALPYDLFGEFVNYADSPL